MTLLALAAAVVPPLAARIEIGWPTPNTAFLEGKAIETYIQPTVSGEPTSGLFGGVRSNGYQFHEGIDLKPVAARDRAGEATDDVLAAMDGVVRHVNAQAGESSYGRYVVIEHPGATPAIYTLYAHLRSVDRGIRAGVPVRRGQVIGVMGRSAGGYAIPRERAHLHFEMGLALTQDFQRWYDAKKFGSPNQQGMWNGMNLMGFDPRAFFTEYEAGRVDDVIEFLRRQPVAVRYRVAASRVPDFVRRYPALVKGEAPLGLVGGWEVECLWTGLPVSLRPLKAAEVAGLRPGAIQILEINRELVAEQRSITLVRRRGAGYQPAGDLVDVVEKLFGPR